MNQILLFISKNQAFSLTILNIILAILLFFQKDPLSLFEKTYEKAPKFVSVSQEEITKFSIQRDGVETDKMLFTKDSGKWQLSLRNKNFLPDEEKIQTFLKTLLDARKFTVITSDENRQTEFGVKGSEAFLVELFKGESSLGKFHIGNLTSGSFTYLRWNDGKEVYLVEDNLKSPMGRGALDYFIEKKMNSQGFTSNEVATIKLNHLQDNKKSYSLIKKGVDWEAETPFQGKVKKEEVDSLARSLGSLAAEEVLLEEPPTDLTERGKYEIIYSFQSEKGGETISLQILGLDKSNYFYARKNNLPTVYKFTNYAFKSIVEFDPNKAKE
ncbi:MAG: DUF4340 domain-containing protein [Leptospiraceae bacterium]|nr:DUF4340 domain-containing protein [Leptospiraceae bacterium]